MTEYDVLDAETGGAKGEDQGNCCCSVWGEGRRVRTDMWEMEVTALSPMVEGKPCSRKKVDLSEPLEQRFYSWEQMQQRLRN